MEPARRLFLVCTYICAPLLSFQERQLGRSQEPGPATGHVYYAPVQGCVLAGTRGPHMPLVPGLQPQGLVHAGDSNWGGRDPGAAAAGVHAVCQHMYYNHGRPPIPLSLSTSGTCGPLVPTNTLFEPV